LKCERIRELVSDALDGALTGSAADRFHAHLDACPPCRTYHAELKESLLLLEELPTIEVGEEFDRAVWARIRREEEPASVVASLSDRLELLRERFPFGTGLWRWNPAIAAAALLLVIAGMSTPSFEKFVSRGGTSPEVAAADNDATIPAVEPVPSPLGGTEVAVLYSTSRREPDVDPAEELVRVDDAASYPSGMPNAVANYVAGRDLRLTNTETYERSNYNYPLRHIADPFQTRRVVRFSPRRDAPVAGTPVDVTVPNRETPSAAVAVFEF
jgi:Putative zinc-finger